MDIVETMRTAYSDTKEVAGWCDLSTYEGSETKVHLLGMHEILLKAADEIELFREAFIQQNKYNFYLRTELERMNEKIQRVQKILNQIDSACKAYEMQSAIVIISKLANDALKETE